MDSYKNIHIGHQLKTVAKLKDLSMSRACQFLKCNVQDIEQMYSQESIDSDKLLRWCKLLDYNFFMLYHSHLQLYSPSASLAKISSSQKEKTERLSYKKNLYSPEIIDYILGKLKRKELSAKEIIERYHIPKTTLYRWKKKGMNSEKEREYTKKDISYKTLYLDFIQESSGLNVDIKEVVCKMIDQWSEEHVDIENLYAVNKLIKDNMTNVFKNIKYQQLNVYDESFMANVFRYQKCNQLSDLSISHQFQMSRNTISKWKKQLGFTH